MPRALVVDDLNMHRTLVTSALEFFKFEVETAEDGLDGLKKLSAGQFDVVFSDIEMPNMNGFEFLAKVKRDPRLGRIPVVMLSTIADAATKARMQRFGAADYLTKPYKMEDIKRALTGLKLM